ncbi:hypothetical protein H5410_041943, partial [Solanum commersonii]
MLKDGYKSFASRTGDNEGNRSLQSGSRLYELQGLNSNKWYEVKISYPVSVSTFTLQLSKGSSGLNVGRKLLILKKTIFRADNSLELFGDK